MPMRPTSSIARGFIGCWNSRKRLAHSLDGPGAAQRTIACDGATLLVHGQCLAGIDELTAGLTAYLTTGNTHDLMQWPGSYSVLVERLGADLTIVADLAGQFPVYFATSETGFWFASEATRLARELEGGVDRSALSTHLLGLANPILVGQRTILSGVRRVEAEFAVRMDHRNRLRRVDVGIRTDDVPSLADCADALRQQLVTGVRLRAEASPDRSMSADLSGGVDSTSLAFLAAGQRTEPLTVVTYHSSVAPVDSDLARATAIAGRSEVFDHCVVEGTAAESPFQELAESPPADLPSAGAIVFARSRLRLAAAAAAGSTLHMTGDGGDLLAGPVPAHLADLAASRDYASLWRHSASWARLRNRPTTSLVSRSLRVGSHTPRHALLRLASGLSGQRPRTSPGTWEDAIAYWDVPGPASWLTPQARTSVVDCLRTRADSVTFPLRWRPSDYAVRSELGAGGSVHRELRTVAEQFGMELHSPYLDTNVLRTCLGLTAGLRTSPSQNKPLFRRALAGLVPATVLDRRSKGDYTRDLYVGLRRSAPFLRALFQSPIAAELGILEPRPLLATLDRALLGLDIPWPAFTRTVATEVWLRHFHRLPIIPTGVAP